MQSPNIPENFKPIASSRLAAYRYFEGSRILDIQFRTGEIYRYWDVPAYLVKMLLSSPSAGKFFGKHFAYSFPYSKWLNHIPPTGGPTNPVLIQVFERTRANIKEILSAERVDFIIKEMKQFPSVINVIRALKSRHGDHRLSGCLRYSLIRVCYTGNDERFFFTLLHELAHACIAQRHGRTDGPHDQLWQDAFANLLIRAADESHFPDDLKPLVLDHARAPYASSDRDTRLCVAFRKYDTVDPRKLVEELPEGALFTRDGKLIFRKGRRIVKKFRCVSTEGRIFHVPASLRVFEVPRAVEPGSS